ncbi:MAG: hypothetical protein U9R00_01285 [Patescibacteria group bacterium]|nr:hypothetical protein [Patescibacteria group bacterium]
MKKNWKYLTIFIGALLFRLIPIPFRVPNIEPIMAAQMPLSKRFNSFSIFFFGFASIAIYDVFTSGIGIWTLITALAYGLVGLVAGFFFKGKKRNYVSFAIVATLIYDAITGLTLGPLFFGQSFMVSLIGQIPFTLLHLIGNVSFAIILSPLIEGWIVKSEVKKEVFSVV